MSKRDLPTTEAASIGKHWEKTILKANIEPKKIMTALHDVGATGDFGSDIGTYLTKVEPVALLPIKPSEEVAQKRPVRTGIDFRNKCVYVERTKVIPAFAMSFAITEASEAFLPQELVMHEQGKTPLMVFADSWSKISEKLRKKIRSADGFSFKVDLPEFPMVWTMGYCLNPTTGKYEKLWKSKHAGTPYLSDSLWFLAHSDGKVEEA